jgi:hypothetical protein
LGREPPAVRRTADRVVQTRLYRTQDDVLTTGDQWKAAMIEKRWSV